MGSSFAEMDEIVFDTGSGWLVLQTTDCVDGCTGGMYDTSSSTAYQVTNTALS
jgi:hypothetical protein